MVSIKVAVIGAGPGGLTTLKTLLEASTREAPVEACIFEAYVSFSRCGNTMLVVHMFIGSKMLAALSSTAHVKMWS